MANPNTQNFANLQDPNREILEAKKADEIYAETYEAAQGGYEEKSRAAQGAVAKYRQTMMGERFRGEFAKQVAGLAPMPEAGEPSSELRELSREKVAAWLDQYQRDLKDALVAMFHLDPKYRMTDDELALFMGELKDPAHVRQKTFFALSDWLGRVERDDESVEVDKADEAAVVDDILSKIANNQPPAELRAKKAA
ncbi:hypothetical protein KJ657_01720 [Patescibacteria group bacterium]|nr:hypothetical protein [Patescibacteria group bacterium]MBU1015787.1 hypothetical protein [Patescibacteria group bacterium]MBU1685340.1 hypothetical protein [Patescibacteria group bacterium]MBU1938268.1 hypothetical protein [Patescibacteria group bacterium]